MRESEKRRIERLLDEAQTKEENSIVELAKRINYSCPEEAEAYDKLKSLLEDE